MRRGILVLLSSALFLGGCGLLPRSERTIPLQACLDARVLSDRRTVLLDALCSKGEELTFFWDLGDGTTIDNGPPVISHVYAPGVYVAALRVTGRDIGGGGRGVPGEPPGAPGAGLKKESWAYAVVDLAELNKPRPVILTMCCGDSTPRTVFTEGFITMTAEASFSPGGLPLVYWWEVVRVDPETLEPIPYPGEGKPRFEYSTAKTWEMFFQGPLPDEPPYRYRITLKIRDSNWQEAIAHHYIWVY